MQTENMRTELERSVAALARDIPRMAAKDACARLAHVRREALRLGCAPAAALADGLASAITRDGKKVPLGTWFDALGLAAQCGAENRDAGPLLLATVGVRFAA